MEARKKRGIAAGTVALIVLLGSIIIALVASKTWNINQYLVSGYEKRGVDVSHYQGEIDWRQIEDQGIDFAFIKATEGSSHVDERFAANWQAAAETGLSVGAYHFFSFDSSGQTQAEWYIQTVGMLEGRLAPAVDVEYYGDKEANPPEKEGVVRELQSFLYVLEEYYQIKPVIYTTYKVYRRYIENEFEEYPLWLRNVYYSPDLDMKGEWLFWQYSDKAALEGYEGTEKYIDFNVFGGTEDEWKELFVGCNASHSHSGQSGAGRKTGEGSSGYPELHKSAL